MSRVLNMKTILIGLIMPLLANSIIVDLSGTQHCLAQPNIIEVMYAHTRDYKMFAGISKSIENIVAKKESNLKVAEKTNSDIFPSDNSYQLDVSKSIISTKEGLIIFLIFILGILIGGWLVFFVSKREIHAVLDEEKLLYLDYKPLKNEKSFFQYITLFHILKKRKDSYKNHNKLLIKQIDDLESENSGLKSKIEN